MIVQLNSYVLNDPSTGNGVYLDEPIDGLGFPPVRTTSGNYSGRDGGYVGAQFYGMRLITLTGAMFSPTPSVLEQTRRDLAAALRSPQVTMLVTTNSGYTYLLYCNLDSLTMPILRTLNKAPFIITLIAPDPIIYDNSVGSALTATVPLSVGGGYPTPTPWPVAWTPGTSPTAVVNSGGVQLYPTITLTGQMTNPVLSNITTGQTFSLTGLTTSAGDQVVIDMRNRTVLLNGGNILTRVSASSSWWPLTVGSNSITLTTGNSADTVSAVISWRPGYMGI